MTKVVLKHAVIKGIEQKAYKALGMTAKVLQDEIRDEQVIPRDTGHLEGEGFVVDTSTEMKGYVRMIYQVPYARRLYFHPEYNFHQEPWVDSKGNTHGANANAQGLWMRHWLEGGKYEDRPQEIFTKILKGKL